MGFFLILVSSFSVGLTPLPLISAENSVLFHKACLSQIPISRHQDLYAALVCGKDLPAGEWRERLRLTGLLHIAVVSGSHLVWLEQWLRRLLGRSRIAGALVFVALFIYALMTNWGAPVVRAGVGLLVGAASDRWAWKWSPVQVVFMSGLVTLCLYPAWIHSLSLLLSWTASLVLASTPRLTNVWRLQVRIYIGLFFCLLPLGAPHPISILCNVLFGPLLGVVLFPATLLTCGFKILTPLLDRLCDGLQWLLSVVHVFIGQGLDGLAFPSGLLWCYLLALQIFYVVSEIRTKRAL